VIRKRKEFQCSSFDVGFEAAFAAARFAIKLGRCLKQRDLLIESLKTASTACTFSSIDMMQI